MRDGPVLVQSSPETDKARSAGMALGATPCLHPGLDVGHVLRASVGHGFTHYDGALCSRTHFTHPYKEEDVGASSHPLPGHNADGELAVFDADARTIGDAAHGNRGGQHFLRDV
jgi:hypothetical protein